MQKQINNVYMMYSVTRKIVPLNATFGDAWLPVWSKPVPFFTLASLHSRYYFHTKMFTTKIITVWTETNKIRMLRKTFNIVLCKQFSYFIRERFYTKIAVKLSNRYAFVMYCTWMLTRFKLYVWLCRN